MRTATDGSTGSNKGRDGQRTQAAEGWIRGRLVAWLASQSDLSFDGLRNRGKQGSGHVWGARESGLRYHRPKAFSGLSPSFRPDPVPSWYQPARAERPKIPSPNTASKDRALHPSSDDTRFFQRAWQVTKNQPRNPRSAFASKLLRLFPDPELVPRRLILPAGASADLQHLPILRGEGLSPRVRADCTLRP